MPKEQPKTVIDNRAWPPGTEHVIEYLKPWKSAKSNGEHTRTRYILPGTYVEPVPPPVDPPPPPPTTSTVFGPGIMSDGKDNRPVGRSDDSHYAVRWHSQGGTIKSIAFNQRFGPDQSNPGMGYSHGSGGLQQISLVSGMLASASVVTYGQRQFQPTNPGTDAEDRRPILFNATIPEGDYCLRWDNIDPDPTHNWMSLNCLYHPSADQPGTDAVVLERTNLTSGQWRVKPDNTPTFQVVFADGHAEGQGYGSIIANTDLDGSGQYSGFKLTGPNKVRQRLVAPRDCIVKAVWLRAKRLSGSGTQLFAEIGAIAGAADVSGIPVTAKTDLNGSVWIRVPLVTTIPVGAFTVAFSTTATLDVMPIRKDGFEQDGWLIPNNGGWAEKTSGLAWSDLYSRGTDLQMYCEVA